MQRVLLLAMLAGCVPTSYAFTPASARTFPGRAEGCAFELMTSPPSKDYDEIGVLTHYNGDLPTNLDKVRSAVATQVCKLGGEAAIAQSNGHGYDKVTVIAYPKPFKPGI
jgi:hypothetical protein